MQRGLRAPTIITLGMLTSFGCRSSGPEPVVHPATGTSTATTVARPAARALATTGVHAEWMDPKVDPCTDFFAYSCGGLLSTLEIPADHATWGPGIELSEDNEKLLRGTLEAAAKDPGGDPGKQKLGAWWSACMDEDRAEKAGLRPIEKLLAIAASVRDTKTLHAAITELHAHAIFPVFDLSSQQDFKDATQMIAGLDQDGLGLPDRDYYLLDDARTKEIRAFYTKHVERMFQLAGEKAADAKRHAADVLRVETALAKLAQDKVTRRDPYAVYHKVDRAGLTRTAKRFPWKAYFDRLGFPALEGISVNSVEYFKGIDDLMVREKAPAWQAYLRWQVLASQASHLTKAFVAERFELRKLLLGQKELEPRWRRCVHSADAALGELLAQEYVRQKFDAEARSAAEAILTDVRTAMSEELDQLAWMDAPTREAAKEKLAKMNGKIGYPKKWREYDFTVSPTDYAANALVADAWELKRLLTRVGKPVDRDEWQMTPPTVNAYYEPSLNEMVFPAGILQPPYFSKTFAAATNYGATGGTMGHELTHGFDDEGSQFDALGNLRNWWSEITGKQFKEQTKCVVDQYAAYDAVPGVKLNGELTAGENIADIGGTKIALAAFREAQKRTKGEVIAGGFTEDQLFFIAYGQSWCEKLRPELLETMAKTNPHSPAAYRVNGVVADIPDFASAFQCREGAPLRPAKACSVW